MATETSEPKTMSSKLLNMRFMKRAAAEEAYSASPTKTREPARKRQKVSSSSLPSSNPVDAMNSNFDVKPRDAILQRQAEAAGDTQWTLEGSGFATPAIRKAVPRNNLNITSAGFNTIDHAGSPPSEVGEVGSGDVSESIERPQRSGRKSFGNFHQSVEQQMTSEGDMSSAGESPGQSDDGSIGRERGKSSIQKNASPPGILDKKGSLAKRDKHRNRVHFGGSNKAAEPHVKEIDLSSLKRISTGGGTGRSGSKRSMIKNGLDRLKKSKGRMPGKGKS